MNHQNALLPSGPPSLTPPETPPRSRSWLYVLVAALILMCAVCAGFALVSSYILIAPKATQAIPTTVAERTLTPTLPLSVPTFPLSSSTSTPTIALPPTATPQKVKVDNPGVSIVVYDSKETLTGDEGLLQIQFLAADSPLPDINIELMHATQDIAGRWVAPDYISGIRPVVRTDKDGIFKKWLDGGNYAIHNGDYTSLDNQLVGNWGIKALFLNSNDPQQMIIFPVSPKKRTEIKVSLGRLEIGVISQDGYAAKGRIVRIACQDKDIAGKKIAVDCGSGWGNTKPTDNTGLTFFNLGAGTYIINVESGREGVNFSDITIKPGEKRREIFKIPEKLGTP